MVFLQEVVTVLLILVGVGFMVISSIGLLRLPDVYTRMHAGGKSSTLGIIAVLLAVAVHTGTLVAVGKMVALILFFFMTAPVAAHMLGRAAYRTHVPFVVEPLQDELADHYEQENRVPPPSQVRPEPEMGAE
jgi:multicomponent Na+:H+ antiporter subunit G